MGVSVGVGVMVGVSVDVGESVEVGMAGNFGSASDDNSKAITMSRKMPARIRIMRNQELRQKRLSDIQALLAA